MSTKTTSSLLFDSASKKPDKVIVVYHPCDEKVTDLKAFFKDLESKSQDALKYIKIGITSDGGKKVALDR